VCRDERTAAVHAAFERSDAEGFKAMRKAREASGIEPPDLDDFVWGQTMGMEEACAHATVENALEAAIEAGDLAVGGRGWRIRQQEITASILDGDYQDQPGQSWRTVVVTERISEWVRTASMRAERVGRRRADIANRLLHPVAPPTDLAGHMEPVTWLLERFGGEQTLTQAGYLNRAFVVQVHEQHPWEDPFRTRGTPRSETDVIVLHRLRAWLESAGALLERSGTVATRDLFSEIAGDAVELGWRTGDGAMQRPPSELDVRYAFHTSWSLLDLFGFAAEHGDWRNRAVSIPPAGESTMLAMLRAVAAGPRSRPW
jgi:hypothetical protein